MEASVADCVKSIFSPPFALSSSAVSNRCPRSLASQYVGRPLPDRNAKIVRTGGALHCVAGFKVAPLEGAAIGEGWADSVPAIDAVGEQGWLGPILSAMST
jgi:hypothetical protein